MTTAASPAKASPDAPPDPSENREGVRRMAGRFVPGKLVMRESFQIPQAIEDQVQEMMGRTP